nr:MAG TPA: hypothetical protein [Caudoviricetes sp.]
MAVQWLVSWIGWTRTTAENQLLLLLLILKKKMNEIKGVLGGLGLAGLISWLGIS